MGAVSFIKIVSAGVGVLLIIFGTIAVFNELEAGGEIDLKTVLKGKIKKGSAGVLLLSIGTILLLTIIIQGEIETHPQDSFTTQTLSEPSSPYSLKTESPLAHFSQKKSVIKNIDPITPIDTRKSVSTNSLPHQTSGRIVTKGLLVKESLQSSPAATSPANKNGASEIAIGESIAIIDKKQQQTKKSGDSSQKSQVNLGHIIVK